MRNFEPFCSMKVLGNTKFHQCLFNYIFVLHLSIVHLSQGFPLKTPGNNLIKCSTKDAEASVRTDLGWRVQPFDIAPLKYENYSISDEELFPYHDEHIIVAVKPSGMLSVPGREIKDSVAFRAAQKFGHERIDKMICHRLDMMTSGLLVLARTPIALQSLHEQFRNKKVRKRYRAVVHGSIAYSEGQIDLPIRLDVENRPRQMVDPFEGKPSLTEWSVVGRMPGRTIVELEPVTGRSHQLRIHMHAIGHPILGDNFYGTEESRTDGAREFADADLLSYLASIGTVHQTRAADQPQQIGRPGRAFRTIFNRSLSDRLMLHAYTLAFEHPWSDEPVEFKSKCPF